MVDVLFESRGTIESRGAGHSRQANTLRNLVAPEWRRYKQVLETSMGKWKESKEGSNGAKNEGPHPE